MHDDVKSAAINPYHMAVQQFELAAEKLNLSEDMREILRQPKRELTVNFPVRLDNGRIKTLQAIVFNTMSIADPPKAVFAMVQT